MLAQRETRGRQNGASNVWLGSRGREGTLSWKGRGGRGGESGKKMKRERKSGWKIDISFKETDPAWRDKC